LEVRSEEGEKTRADFTTSPNDRLRNGMVSLLHLCHSLSVNHIRELEADSTLEL